MAGGAMLRERSFRWTECSLQRPSSAPERIGERGVNALRKVAFVARDGFLPPGRLSRWFEFDWRITGAGLAWLEANKYSRSSQSAQSVHVRRTRAHLKFALPITVYE